MKRAGRWLLGLVVLVALLAPWLAPNPPDRSFAESLYAPPTRVHLFPPFIYQQRLVSRLERRFEDDLTRPVALRWFSAGRLTSVREAEGPLLLLGADAFGRDIFSRLVYGARASLALAAVATLAALLVGALVGGVAGYAGGAVDNVLSRFTEFILVLPAIYVALALRAAMPLVLPASTVFALLAAIFALLGWPIVARGVRAIVVSESEREYVAAGQALGATPWRVLSRHVLPAAGGYLTTQATLLLPAFILAEATLSYVGLGFPEQVPTWGTMLHDAANVSLVARAPWMLAPAAAIFIVVLAVNLAVQGTGRPPVQLGAMTRREPQGAEQRQGTKKFSGVFTPIVTPFTAGDTLDEQGLRKNVARWMTTPLTGLVVLGSNGEAPQLDDDEADRVVEIVRAEMPRNRPMIVGTGRESTKATIAATKRAAAAGADAVLVRTPAFFKSQMTTDIFVRHYVDVADASSVPVMLYNVSMFTGVNLLPEAVARLAKHPNIVGMKESGSDIAQIADYIGRTPDDFTLLAGSAATLFPALCVGCDGAVLALAALAPEACVRLTTLVRDGNIEEARELQTGLLPLARSIGGLHGVPALKAALDLMGYAGGYPRPPLRPAAPQTIDLLRSQLQALGLLEPVHQ